MADQVMIHPTAEVSPQATVGDGTRVWNEAQIRAGAWIGRDCWKTGSPFFGAPTWSPACLWGRIPACSMTSGREPPLWPANSNERTIGRSAA